MWSKYCYNKPIYSSKNISYTSPQKTKTELIVMKFFMALYHKYRPQFFKDVIGQEHIIKTISNQIINNTIAHAYLFSGPRGVGKTTTARLIAKAITCPRTDKTSAEPDNSKENAKEIAEGRSIDVIEIDAASHTGVDNVRENIIENAQFKPTKLSYKIFIIDEVHMLSTSAFNALLKIIEEPPAYVIFILATTELHKIPSTIVSRCQRFTFQPVKRNTISTHINTIAKKESVTIDSEVVDAIVTKSEGCVRDAVSLLEQVLAIGKKHISVDDASALLPKTTTEEMKQFINALGKRETEKALSVLTELYEQGVNFIQFTDNLISTLRDLLISGISKKDKETSISSFYTNIEVELDTDYIATILETLMLRRTQIRKSPIPQLPLELAVISLCSTQKQPLVDPSRTSTETKSEPINQEEVNRTTTPPPKDTAAEIITPKTVVQKKDQQHPQTTKENVDKPKKEGGHHRLEHIEKEWQRVITKAEAVSPSLVFILKTTKPVFVDEKNIILHVEYAFHKDKLLEPGCTKKVADILKDIYNTPIEFTAVVQKDAAREKKEEDEAMQKLAESFGGEIIS